MRCSCTDERESPVRKTLVQNLITYGVAAAIIWYAARGISFSQVAEATGRATLWLFMAASLGGFLCWFVGETLLYSRLFTRCLAANVARQAERL